MSTLTLERPLTTSTTTAEAIRLIQVHLDKEAFNRRQTSLHPRELCPMQKAELVLDLAALLR